VQEKHQALRTPLPLLLPSANRLLGCRRWPEIVEIAPRFLSREYDREKVKGHAALYATRTDRAKHLHTRGVATRAIRRLADPLRDEVERYGALFTRRGRACTTIRSSGLQAAAPNLGARLGRKYLPMNGHVDHLRDPRSVRCPGMRSLPPYAFLSPLTKHSSISKTLEIICKTLRFEGVPFQTKMMKMPKSDLVAQAEPEAIYDDQTRWSRDMKPHART